MAPGPAFKGGKPARKGGKKVNGQVPSWQGATGLLGLGMLLVANGTRPVAAALWRAVSLVLNVQLSALV